MNIRTTECAHTQNHKSTAKALTLMIQATVLFAIMLSGSNLQAALITYDLVGVQNSSIDASITGYVTYDTSAENWDQYGYDLFVAANSTLGNGSTIEFDPGDLQGSGFSSSDFFIASLVGGFQYQISLDFSTSLGNDPANTLTLAGASFESNKGNSEQYALTGSISNASATPEPGAASLLLFGALVLIGGNRLRRYRLAAATEFTESR